MSEHKTLLQFLLDLFSDPDAREAFQENPHAALEAAGLGDVSLDDIRDVLPLVLDHAHPEVAACYERDLERHHHDCDPQPDCEDGHAGGHREWTHEDHCWSPQHGDEIDKIVTHLNFVTNNYSFDSHDTVFNTTINQEIWSHGGDVDASIDFSQVVGGDGAVLIGGDNNAPVTTGDGNVVGDGNQVAGQNSTAAFGDGSAYSVDHVGANDGGAVAIGGSASGNQANTDVTNFGHGNTTGTNGASVSSSDSHDTTTTNSNNHGSGNTDSHDDNSTWEQDNSHTDSSTHLHTEDNSDHSIDVSHNNVDLGLPIF